MHRLTKIPRAGIINRRVSWLRRLRGVCAPGGKGEYMSDKCGRECKEDIKAKALKAAGMVDYKAGAVVSRTLIDKKTGTVTLFAFDKGAGLSEHTAPFDALVQIIDGQADIFIEGRRHGVKAGEFIIMPAEKSHSLKAVKRFKMALVMIRS